MSRILQDVHMNYYEKLMDEISKSMVLHPKSAMVMDMSNFKVIARSNNLDGLSKKMSGKTHCVNTIVFQKPNRKASWIL